MRKNYKFFLNICLYNCAAGGVLARRQRKIKVKPERVVHFLIPPHTILSEKEVDALLRKYRIGLGQLAKIHAYDPAIAHLGAKPGDVVCIARPGEAPYYRVVV